MEWEAWYTARRRFTCLRSEPPEMPKDGMLGVVKWLRKRSPKVWDRQILSGQEHYFFWQGEWFSTADSREEILKRYPGSVIVRGKWTTSREMNRVQRQMRDAKEPPSCRR